MINTLIRLSPPAPPGFPLKRGHRLWWHNAVQGILGLIVVIICLEFFFALAGVGEQEYLQPDPILGFSPIAGKSVTWRKEGFARIKYNSQGMQDIERSLAKHAGTVRIAMMGDSYVESLQVRPQDNFCWLLENSLKKCFPHRNFEVLNFGVSAYNLGQIYLYLKEKALLYKPDIALLFVRIDATFQLVPNPRGGFLYARPSFFLNKDGNLYPDYSVQRLWSKSLEAKRIMCTAWLREHSRIWSVFSSAVEQGLAWYQGVKASTNTPNFTPSDNENAPQNAGQFNHNNIAEEGCTRTFWPIAHALIKQMAKECNDHHCQLCLVRLPGIRERENSLESKLLHQSAQRLNLPLLDTTKDFRTAWLSGNNLFYSTHLNPQGHKLLASKLLPFVASAFR